jgi:hypothetical protein
MKTKQNVIDPANSSLCNAACLCVDRSSSRSPPPRPATRTLSSRHYEHRADANPIKLILRGIKLGATCKKGGTAFRACSRASSSQSVSCLPLAAALASATGLHARTHARLSGGRPAAGDGQTPIPVAFPRRPHTTTFSRSL